MHCSRIRAAMGIRQSRQSNQVFLRGQKRAISEQFPPSGVYTLCSPHFPWATIERRVPQKKPGRGGLQFPIFRNRTWQKTALVSRKRKAIKTFTGEEDKKLFKRGRGWTDINALLALGGNNVQMAPDTTLLFRPSHFFAWERGNSTKGR